MKKVILSILLALSTIFTLAHASNYGFLATSPMAYLTQTDYKFLMNAQQTALNSRDGAKISWKNPKTGAFGTIIPSHTTRVNGLLCRNLTLSITAHNLPGQSTHTFCKYSDGWKATN